MAIIPVINIGGADYPIADEQARQDISEIQSDVEGLQTDVEGLQSDVEGLQSDVEGLQTDVDGLQTDVEENSSDITALSPYENLTWILKYNIDANGNLSSNNYMAVTEPIVCHDGGRIVRLTPERDSSDKFLMFYVSQFNGSTFISRTQIDNVGGSVELSHNATSFRIAIGRQSASGTQISQADIDTYFNAGIYLKTVSYAEYDGKTFVFRGSISDLGYTSFEQCNKTGFYTFGGSDSISDIPDGWIGGGLVKVHVSGGVIWQELLGSTQHAVRYGTSGSWIVGFSRQGKIATLEYTSIGQCIQSGFYTFTGSDAISDLPDGWIGGGLVRVYVIDNAIWQELIGSTQHFIRYGTSGSWTNRDNYIYVKYTAGAGDDSSDAQLEIVIPKRSIKNPSSIVYTMGHCADASINADVWRIMYMYLQTNSRRKLTINGEWECAIHLEDRDDFSGGIVHGDEIDQSVTVFVDGTPTDISEINGFCNELRLVRNSLMYDPNNHQTVIADHGVEYKYTLEGLHIKQSLKWRVSAPLTACFLAMLPIVKAYSTQRFSDVDFIISTNSETDYSVTIPDAKSVTEYNADYDVFTEMSITEYPSGLTGGDCALITDNKGRGYNKVYFPVCTEGTSQIGELWKSETIYRSK